ncbi:ribosome maturation factor RimM [Rarobacter incanus]|uniref:Ribosome maturation factor RimM n=1 Tax=Rarobacter incanus TaxID=153494 RepID=A0A542SLA8_9MICO|nr:ribosome maturation factor RimM [Rarobacter incanus]TQK75416.1 16S rRNA processing protein RimM [Rarobacter incanus]
MELIVARIDRAQGLRGEVAITVRTDDPDRRFVPGRALRVERAPLKSLTIAAARTYKGRWYLRFDEVSDRDGAEQLRGAVLSADIEALDDGGDEDAWYPHELIGLRVERVDGRQVGTVTGLEHMPAQDLLVVREPGGSSLIPLVRQIVPIVDTAGGRVVIDPPGGLLHADGEDGESAS